MAPIKGKKYGHKKKIMTENRLFRERVIPRNKHEGHDVRPHFGHGRCVDCHETIYDMVV